MLRLGSPSANSTSPESPKAAGGSRGRRGSRGCGEGGLGRNVFNHSSHLPSVTLRLRRDAAEGAGTAGRCWMLRLPRRLCGVWTCWRVAGLVQTRQQQRFPGVWLGSSRAESSPCPCGIPRAAPSSGDAAGAASAADAFPRLQHLKRRLLASSSFPDCCFQAVISREMSSDAAGPSGHWQRAAGPWARCCSEDRTCWDSHAPWGVVSRTGMCFGVSRAAAPHSPSCCHQDPALL